MEAPEGQTQGQYTANQQVGKCPKDHRLPRRLLTDSSGGPWEQERLVPPSSRGGPGASQLLSTKATSLTQRPGVVHGATSPACSMRRWPRSPKVTRGYRRGPPD